MTCSATSFDTISRIRGDVGAFGDVDISSATGGTVSDLLKRVAGMQSWLSAAQALLISRADVLANPEPSPFTPPPPRPGPESPHDTEPEPGPESEPAGPSAQDQLTNESNMSEREARRARRRADLLKLLPKFQHSMVSNHITAEHVDAISNLADKATPAELDQFIELANNSNLHLLAGQQSVEEFTDTIQAILAGLRCETPEERLQRQRAMSFLRIWENEHGMTVINGELDPETGNRIREVIEADLKSLWAANTDKLFPIPDGVPHNNRAAWLRGQALLYRLTQTSTTPASKSTNPDSNPDSMPGPSGTDIGDTREAGAGRDTPPVPAPATAPPVLVLGPPAEIVLFADYDKLTSRLSQATGEPCGHFADQTPVGAATIRRIACDAAVLPIIFKPDGEPLNTGRRTRTANRSQRRALQKLYGGCMFCNAPFNWCQIHHFWHWLDGGPSDLWNLGPVCSHHHHQIHDHDHAITRNDDGTLNLTTATGAIIHTTEVTHPRPPVDKTKPTTPPTIPPKLTANRQDPNLANTANWVSKARPDQLPPPTRDPNTTLF